MTEWTLCIREVDSPKVKFRSKRTKKPVQGDTNSPFNPTTDTIDSKKDEVSDEAV